MCFNMDFAMCRQIAIMPDFLDDIKATGALSIFVQSISLCRHCVANESPMIISKSSGLLPHRFCCLVQGYEHLSASPLMPFLFYSHQLNSNEGIKQNEKVELTQFNLSFKTSLFYSIRIKCFQTRFQFFVRFFHQFQYLFLNGFTCRLKSPFKFTLVSG